MGQVDGDSDMVPACTCSGRAEQRNSGFCQDFCLKKAAHSALALKLHNSVPLHMSLETYKLMPQHWNPGFGGLVWGWDPLLLMGGPLQWRYLLIFIRHTHQTVSRLYPSLPVSMWLLLHTLSCRTSVQLDFRCFCMMVIL